MVSSSFFRSLAAQKASDDNESMTSHPVGDAKLLPATLDDPAVSTPTTSSSSSSVDTSVFRLSGVTCTVEAVGNGHVTKTAPNFRLAGRTAGGDFECELPPGSASNSQTSHHYQQQQQQDASQNSQLPRCSKTITSAHITPVIADSTGHRGIQQRHPDAGLIVNGRPSWLSGHNSAALGSKSNDAVSTRDRGQHNVLPPNGSRTISSTEKTRLTDDCLRHQQHQPHHQQLQQPQLHNLNSFNSSNTMSLMQKNRSRVTDDQFQHSLERLHLQRQQQPERQQNATSKDWNGSTSTTLMDFTQLAGERVGLPLPHRRPPPAPPSSLPLHAPVLSRTPTVGDGPSLIEVERKMSLTTMQPGQTAQDSFVVSTLPRAKFQTPNGEVHQRQPVHPQPTTTAVRPPQMLSVNGRPNWLGGPNSPAATLKSKDVAPFTRDRVQFFTRNELAAAVALNKSSDGAKTATSSKTSWLRRTLFKNK